MPNDTPPRSSEDRRWTTLSSEKLLERWWITLRADHVRLPTGAEMEEFHVAEYPDWALAVALTEDGQAVLVDQYRYAIDRVGLEFAAGVIHAGEPPVEAARRELARRDRLRGRRVDSARPMRRRAVAAHELRPPLRRDGRASRRRSRPRRHGGLARPARRRADLVGLVERGEIVHGTHIAAVFWAVQRGLIPG